MEFLHKEFDLVQGDIVEVTLSGNAANVLLLNPDNYQNYRQGKPCTYYGGYARITPFRIEVPKGGRWHLVIDLGGGAGRVQASSRIISRQLS
jgi:uncharacterized protein DUF1883